MKHKEQRWYDVTTDEQGVKTLNVYSHPDKSKAHSSSHTKIEELPYYRNTFKLCEVWTQEEIEKNNQDLYIQ